MAFEVKYRSETSDIKGVKWTADILEDGFTGTITYLTGTGSPLVFDFDNGSDDVFDPIRPSSVSINVWSMTNFTLQNLYSSELLQFWVNIYADTVLFWSGWVKPSQYKEGYDQPPYPVSINATDGLELLSCEYVNGNEYYNGHRYESQIILDCLGRIGFTEFKEYVNLYEDNINSTVDDSPMDQILVDSYVFREYNCIEVLTEILQKYNAFIRQKDGVFAIIRPKELLGTTVAGRYFTAYNVKTSITLTPLQYINRSSYTSYRRQVPGGIVMIQDPVADVSCKFDYGNRESWINNHELAADTYPNDAGDCFQDWTAFGVPLVNAINGENDGCQIPYNTVPGSNYITQSFAPYSVVTTTDNLFFEFEWMFYNGGSTVKTDVELRIEIKADGGDYYLANFATVGGTRTTACTWHGSSAYYISIEEDALVGQTGWNTWKGTFSVLYAGGSYTIKVFPLYNSDSNIYLGIKNIKFYTSSVELTKVPVQKKVRKKFAFIPIGWELRPFWNWVDSYRIVDIKQRVYHATNAIAGKIVENEFHLGDVTDTGLNNVVSQFAGALVRNAGGTSVKVDTITLYGSSGTINVISGGYTAEAEFNTSLTQTATDFVTTHAAAFLSSTTLIVTSSGADIIITAPSAGFDFTTWTEELTGNLMGVVDSGLPYSATFSATSAWSTGAGGSGSESLSILQLIANEVAVMYNRPKQLVQMPIYETTKTLQMNLLGNIQDAVNLYNGAMRIFCVNRGTFDVRHRKWELDLFEIGTGAVPTGGTSATADSTLVTSDSTLITSDTTI